VTFHLVDYNWLIWAFAFAVASVSAAVGARRHRSNYLWLASACAGVCSVLWLFRFAVHWLIGAKCVGEHCLTPTPYASLLSFSSALVPWLALLGAVLSLHYVWRSSRAA
jgi:hypothetical protein